MAFKKAERGTKIKWIGIQFEVTLEAVIASVTADKLEEVKAITNSLLMSNVVAKKLLRTYTGKMQAIASLLYALRPYVARLWAALYSADGPAKHCILDDTDSEHARLVHHFIPLVWSRADFATLYVGCPFGHGPHDVHHH